MPEPATVLYQIGGTGVIVFSGQVTPAAAIRADTLKHLHGLARLAIERTKAGDTDSQEFRQALQDLHLEIATLLLSLQDTARGHGLRLPLVLQVSSKDFVYLEQGEHR